MRQLPRRGRSRFQGLQRNPRRPAPGKLKAIGRAPYEKAPDEKELAAWGLKLTDFPEKDVEVWPEHVNACLFFCAVSTQWRVGMGGATGLDYPAVFGTLDRLHRDKTPEERDAIFADLQVIERSALEAMAEKD
ncbi:MAG: DUF1799 domain-containing protein [Acidovorax sp.]